MIDNTTMVKMWNARKSTRYPSAPESAIFKEIAKWKELKGEDLVEQKFRECLNDTNKNDIWKDFANELCLLEKPQELNVMEALSKELLKVLNKDLLTQFENKANELLEQKTLIKIVDYQGQKTKVEGLTHRVFNDVLKFVSMDEPVMLVGPAGSGKNIICSQVAKTLGLEFYPMNKITQEFQVEGYGDANGNFVETMFYKAFTQGGVLMLDEIDASIPEALVDLNCAIANRYFNFPVIGRVQAHKDFRVIACANTYGHGATTDYVGRYQLDGATLNRFGVIYVDYDSRIEEMKAENDMELLSFMRDFRNVADKNNAHIIVSYRNIGRMAKMIHHADMDKKTALATCLINGIDNNTLRIISQELNKNNAYTKVLVDSLI